MLLDTYTFGQSLDPRPVAVHSPVKDMCERLPDHASIELHDESSPDRQAQQRFILDRFKNKHSATIREFMPHLIELRLYHKIAAVVGIRTSFERPFFLEVYLDKPIEDSLSTLSNQRIHKEKIVEIGNLAAANARTGSLLISLLAKSLYCAGYHWMVFTATDEVEKMVAKLGCEQTVLSKAQQSKLVGSKSDWGSYYDNQPKVIACNLAATIAKAESNPSLSRLLTSYSKQTYHLAAALALANQPRAAR